jgi:DNA-binding transcriptional regulator GbsR (MarR family)
MCSTNMDMAKDYWQPPSDIFKYKHEKQIRQNNKQVRFLNARLKGKQPKASLRSCGHGKKEQGRKLKRLSIKKMESKKVHH